MDKNVKLMDEMMDSIAQSEEWNRIQLTDPMVQDATQQPEACIDRIGLSEDDANELFAAASDYAYSTGLSAILYGIHVADAIRDVAARPVDLSRYIMKRVEARHDEG